MTSADQPHRRERFLFLGAGLLLLLAMLFGIAREQRWGTRYVSINMRASDVAVSAQDRRCASLASPWVKWDDWNWGATRW